MPTDKRKPKRPRYPSVPVAAPLIQVMPRLRVRIDPTAVPDLACWVFALRYRYDRQSRATLRGLKGHQRKLMQGRIRSAKLLVRAMDELTALLFQTVDLHLFDLAKREWMRALPESPSAIPERSGEGESLPAGAGYEGGIALKWHAPAPSVPGPGGSTV